MSTAEHPARLRRLMFRWTIFPPADNFSEMTADVRGGMIRRTGGIIRTRRTGNPASMSAGSPIPYVQKIKKKIQQRSKRTADTQKRTLPLSILQTGRFQ